MSPNGPKAALIQFAVTATIALLGLGAAIATLGGIAATQGYYGGLNVAWLMAIAGALLLSVAMGWVSGFLAPGQWYAAPGAAVVFYGLFVATRVVPLPYGVKSLYPVITNYGSVFVRFVEITMWSQLALFVGATVLLVLVVDGQLKSWFRRASAPIFASIGLIAVGSVIVLATNGQYTSGFNSRDFVCAKGSTTICLNRGYQNAMSNVTPVFDRMSRLVAHTPLEFRRLEQNVEGVGDAPSQGARSLYLEQNDAESARLSAYLYLVRYGGSTTCADNYDARIASFYVDSWLSQYTTDTDGYPAKHKYENLRRLDPESGNRWLRDHYTKYMSCTLTFADLP